MLPGAAAPAVVIDKAGSSAAPMSLTARLVGGLRARSDEEGRQGRAQEGLSPELAAALIQSVEGQGSGWFWATDRFGCVSYVSEKVARQLEQEGLPPIGRPLTEVLEVGGNEASSERTLHFHLNARTSFTNFEVQRADGAADLVWSISGRPLLDEYGQFRGFVGYGNDLSAERRSDAEIKRLAMFDSLTGLANRARMRHSLDQMISHLERVNRPVALFMLDLDRFKAVNDTLGHQAGDQLLKMVAQRLERAVGDEGLVGRLGGDEFQVILTKYAHHAQLKALADSIISSLSQPYFILGTNITIGCSIGIAIAPDHAHDSETLVRNADLALYSAKAGGRGNKRFFQEDLLVQARTRKAMEDDLRQALERGQLGLVYQPVVSTETQQVVGYEALLRWDHPRGPVSPAEFIPVAEDCGLIHPIGEWVLRTACADAAAWPAPVRVAVNVSPVQFTKAALPAIVRGALAQSGLDPNRLELEITEGVLLNEDNTTLKMIEKLKQTGLRLVLDDFGTGYSSLGYLKKAPFDKVKIDQSFVRGAAHDPQNMAIIRAVVAMADTLKLETTAEGVETQDEIALITELGCSHIQGFVYGEAVPLARVHEQLTAEGALKPVGLKVSRPPRVKLLRSAQLRVGGKVDQARIRDISSSGLMIDGFQLPLVPGVEVAIDISDGPTVAGIVRWVGDGRAGLQLTAPLDLAALSAKPRPSVLRRHAAVSR